ncbi:NRDE family protein, partial [Pandoraea sputorum]|uniref:NRDE family protein n=2 Tax=Pseudomonadota TaxID=1224 RepID=UPI003557F886
CLQAGVYGLSNARLDTPWPKLRKARAALEGNLHDPQPERLLALLADAEPAPQAQLPDTGVGLQTEILLSSVFITSGNYGTRASTVLIVSADGQQRIIERSFGPFGARLGD